MSLEQPQADIVLPIDLQNAINNARNIVTINQAESERLKGLIQSQEYSIMQLHNQMTESQTKLDAILTDVEAKTNILADLTAKCEAANTELVNTQNETDILKADLAVELAAHDERLKAIGEQVSQIEAQGFIINTREAELAQKEMMLNATLNRIADFKASM